MYVSQMFNLLQDFCLLIGKCIYTLRKREMKIKLFEKSYWKMHHESQSVLFYKHYGPEPCKLLLSLHIECILDSLV
jgi:hypothetical protein